MKLKKVIKTLVPVAVIGAATGAVIYRNLQKFTPEGTMKAFKEALNNKDVDGMINCLVPELQEEANMTKEPLEVLFDTVPFVFKLVDFSVLPEIEIDVTKKNVVGSTAILESDVTIVKKDYTFQVNVVLERVKRQWLIKEAKPSFD